MPDPLAAVLAVDGLGIIAATVLIAGVVYGFAGFGSALIVLPVMSRYVAPEVAIAAFSLSALASFVTVVPGAWRQADRPATLQILLASLLTTPIGILALRAFPEETIRWGISGLALVTLAALIAGWRVSLPPGPLPRLAIGGAAGLAGGATGLHGPVVILFNLASGLRAETVRANTAVFLTITSLTMLPQLWAQGLLRTEALGLGAALLVLYAVGTALGTRLFRPGYETLYRSVAYTLIGVAALSGLPLWPG